jgi:hypothetical protein
MVPRITFLERYCTNRDGSKKTFPTIEMVPRIIFQKTFPTIEMVPRIIFFGYYFYKSRWFQENISNNRDGSKNNLPENISNNRDGSKKTFPTIEMVPRIIFQKTFPTIEMVPRNVFQ